MSLVSTTIPNLVNGVSQQPYALRLASQAELQDNGYSSVVEGLRKRPPARHAAKLLNTPLTNAFLHTINRDSNERYVMFIAGGDLRVFRLDGSEVPVKFPEGKGYLAAANTQEDFSCVTVADYTFIVNKRVTTRSNPAITVPARPHEAMFWVRQGAYGTNYKVTVKGVTATYKTPNGANTADTEKIATDYIVDQLLTQLTTGLSGQGLTLTKLGSVIYVSHPTTDFDVHAEDGLGDQALRLIKGTVQRFSDLPAKGVPDFRVRVRGQADTAFDDYYVDYETDANNPYGGVWREAAAGGEVTSLLPSTMPHALVREANGEFTFKTLEWLPRKAGDLDSVPMPSFVDRPLNDIFFHRNRLGFLADENVVFSRAGDFFNFFRASAIQTLDTDPIDVAVSHVKVSILRHAIPFNESLLLFSDQTQFTMGQSDLLTPSTTSINQSTEFECSLRAKPVGAGQNVYFAVNRGQYTGIREYYVQADTETNDAAEVTAHCPQYVPKGVVKLAASSNEDVLVALSETERSNLYVYRYYWSGTEKLQSSWSRWVFHPGDSILQVDFIESDLWVVVSRADGTYLEVISLEPGRVDTGERFQIHLDRRVDESQCSVIYNELTNRTEVTLPYGTPSGSVIQFVGWNEDEPYKVGGAIPFEAVTNGFGSVTYHLRGNVTQFFAGLQYCLRYRFSTLVAREDAAGGGGQQPIGEGRLQLRNMTLTYNSTGYFRVEVTPFARETFSYVFSGRIVGAASNVIGQVAINEGTFRFPIAARNTQVKIEVVNDSPLPSAFLSAEWEAFMHVRSRRL